MFNLMEREGNLFMPAKHEGVKVQINTQISSQQKSLEAGVHEMLMLAKFEGMQGILHHHKKVLMVFKVCSV